MAALLIPVLLTGCGGQFSVIVAPSGFADPAAMITWVIVTPARFQAGETVQVEVGFKNPTNRPIRMHFASGCIASYVVRDGNDAVVAPYAMLCTAEARTIVFAAGESGTSRFSWDGTSRAGEPLPPGEYHVLGGFTESADVHTSAPVAVEILAP